MCDASIYRGTCTIAIANASCVCLIRLCDSMYHKSNLIGDFLRYMFDEPSSYLDVKQRLKAAQAIRNLLAANK